MSTWTMQLILLQPKTHLPIAHTRRVVETREIAVALLLTEIASNPKFQATPESGASLLAQVFPTPKLAHDGEKP